MHSVAKVGRIMTREANVNFVDQGSRLEGVSGTLVSQMFLRDATQLGVDQWKKRSSDSLSPFAYL